MRGGERVADGQDTSAFASLKVDTS